MTKIRTGHIVAGLVGAGVSAALASRPTAARIAEHNKELDQIEARYAERKAQLETSIAIGQSQSKKIEDLRELVNTYERENKEITQQADFLNEKWSLYWQKRFDQDREAFEKANDDLRRQLSEQTNRANYCDYQRDELTRLLATCRAEKAALEQKVKSGMNEYGMTSWFVAVMTGKTVTGNSQYPGKLDGAEPVPNRNSSVLIMMESRNNSYATLADEMSASRAYADVPNFGKHNHPQFNADWVRKGSDGKWYRPTHWNDWR